MRRSQPPSRWTTISTQPIGPSDKHERWEMDRGAIPGEPLCSLDIPCNAYQYASATITALDDTGSDDTRYLATVHTPRPGLSPDLHTCEFETLVAAQAWAEAHAAVPVHPLPITIQCEEAIRRHYRPQLGEVLISIREPGTPPLVPAYPFHAIFHLAAWDIPYRIRDAHRDLHPLRHEEAKALLDFILQQRNAMTKLTIHCHVGVSRSPAVAIALAEWLDTTPHIYGLISAYPLFNRQLYRTLCQVAMNHGLIPS